MLTQNAKSHLIILIKNSNESILVVSYQVINEVSNIMRKHKSPEIDIRFVIEKISGICIIQDFSIDILLSASNLRGKYSLSFWDSILVASASAAK
jgi:predicted nucleic acid-binding protein